MGEQSVFIAFAVGSAILVLMASFSVSFITYYQKKRQETIRQQQQTSENHQRELLQSQLEMQNQTLQRVGQELHDHIGQLLTVTLMQLNNLEDELAEGDLYQAVGETRDLVGIIINDVRALSKTLDFQTVERFGLVSSLQLELARIQRATHVLTSLAVSGDEYAFGDQTETVLFRMAQEALANALKHARARSLTVAVDYSRLFQLTVTDDGEGFNVASVRNRPIDESGAGLENLYRRAQLLGGSCLIESEPGKGTRVVVAIPYPQPDNKEDWPNTGL